MPLDHRWVARIRSGGREKEAVGNSSSGDGAAMAGDKEHASVHGSVATGHGSKNRGHQESEGVKGTSDRPIRRPKERAEAAVTIAGDAELPSARG